MILAIAMIFAMTGCRYYHHCCTPVDGPMVDWPTEAVKPEKPVEKPKEQTKAVTKKKSEAPEVKPETEAKPAEPVEPPEITPEEPKVKKPVEPITEKTAPTTKPEAPIISEPKPPSELLDPDLLGEEKPKASLESTFEGTTTGIIKVPHLVKCIISNRGNKAVDNFHLKTILPKGLVFEDDAVETTKMNKFDKLEPGNKKIHEFKVVAEKVGPYTIQAEVILDEIVVHTSSFALEMKDKPKLSLNVNHPAKVNMEVQFEYTISITNPTQVALKDVTVEDKLQEKSAEKKTAAGFIYISSTPEGIYDEESGIVTWKIGDLNPSQEKSIKIKLTAIEKGIIPNTVIATDAQKLVREEKKIEIEVQTAIGLQLNQFDTTDPVEVGEKTTYVLEVSNQGFKDATNVRIVDMIPVEAAFVEANVEGTEVPITHKLEGNKVIFDPIDFLKPGSKVIFRITIKATQPGDLLNNVEVQTAEFGSPIIKGEGTKAFKAK